MGKCATLFESTRHANVERVEERKTALLWPVAEDRMYYMQCDWWFSAFLLPTVKVKMEKRQINPLDRTAKRQQQKQQNDEYVRGMSGVGELTTSEFWIFCSEKRVKPFAPTPQNRQDRKI